MNLINGRKIFFALKTRYRREISFENHGGISRKILFGRVKSMQIIFQAKL